MKKIGCIVFAIVSAALLFANGAKDTAKSLSSSDALTLEEGKLKVGVEIGYPPMEYFAEDGKTPVGFDVELANALGKKLGLTIEFIDTAWDGIFAGLDTNRYDVIISSVTITEERKAKYDFTIPYIGNGQSLVVRKDTSLSVAKPEDLKGLRVGYQAECTSDFFMDKQAANGLVFTPEEYDKVMNAFDDLKLGRCDVVCADALVSVSYISPADTPFKMVWQGTPDEMFGICLKKGNAKLQLALNKALEELIADGTLVTISNNVFAADLVSSVLNK
ncbi:MAG: ABC transporter substrate-binding protein [Treponema sp.]|nr:ABC transporter substrate-binding protein [Treponema sp.]